MNFTFKHLETVGSTNEYTLKMINRDGAEEGFVVWANEQTKGKGHGSNNWESEKDKNLVCSIVLRPSFIDPSEQFKITQIISIALHKLISTHLPEEKVRIKWPNDIYVNDKKIAGVLIQNNLKGSIIDYAVIGVGLNINQKKFLSGAPNPVSLFHFSNTENNVEEILHKLLFELSRAYENTANATTNEELNNYYLKHLYRFEKWSKFKRKNQRFEGKITGVGQFGRLILKMKDGQMREFDFKEVEFVI